MEIRQSTFDPNFWEVLSDGIVLQEIAVSFPLKNIPRYFANLEEINSWLEKTEYKRVKNAALYLVARRSYSKAMLFKKLKDKKFSQKQCLKVIGEFETLGYLSDHDYAQMLLEQKMRQGYGPRYIEQYFRTKGLDPKLVKITVVEEKQAMKKWEQKIRGKEPQKKIAFLLKKGFSFDAIRN